MHGIYAKLKGNGDLAQIGLVDDENVEQVLQELHTGLSDTIIGDGDTHSKDFMFFGNKMIVRKDIVETLIASPIQDEVDIDTQGDHEQA